MGWIEKELQKIVLESQKIQEDYDKNPEAEAEFIKTHPEYWGIFESDPHCKTILDTLPEYKERLTPKCPTCGSEKIRRISATEKVTSTIALGFFSNKRKQQFECLNPNCRYKW